MHRSIFLMTSLIIGCSGSGMMGCGDSSGDGVSVDSALTGVYEITSYQGSQESCDDLTEVSPSPDYLVLYAFRPNDTPERPRLGGAFCGDPDGCRALAQEAPEPTIGYSFLEGNDQAGWRGWGIESSGGLNDQCRADVQTHTLSSTSSDEIAIETRTMRTVFPPDPESQGNQADCSNAAAITALDSEPPPACVGALSLRGTRESSL